MKKIHFLFIWCFLFLTTAMLEAKNTHSESQSAEDEQVWSLLIEKGEIQLFYSYKQDGNAMLKAVNYGSNPIQLRIILDSGKQTDMLGNEVHDHKEYEVVIESMMSKEISAEGMTFPISDYSIQIQVL